jgi:hypothetical protein
MEAQNCGETRGIQVKRRETKRLCDPSEKASQSSNVRVRFGSGSVSSEASAVRVLAGLEEPADDPEAAA